LSADPAQGQKLQRSVIGQTFDELPLSELDSEAIDFRAASESFAPKRKLAKSDLKTLHLVVRHQGKDPPTVGGIRDRRIPGSPDQRSTPGRLRK